MITKKVKPTLKGADQMHWSYLTFKKKKHSVVLILTLILILLTLSRRAMIKLYRLPRYKTRTLKNNVSWCKGALYSVGLLLFCRHWKDSHSEPCKLESEWCSWMVHLQLSHQFKSRWSNHSDERDHHTHLVRWKVKKVCWASRLHNGDILNIYSQLLSVKVPFRINWNQTSR